jgi:hypothetical protein
MQTNRRCTYFSFSPFICWFYFIHFFLSFFLFILLFSFCLLLCLVFSLASSLYIKGGRYWEIKYNNRSLWLIARARRIASLIVSCRHPTGIETREQRRFSSSSFEKSQTVRLWFRAASTITGHQSLKFLLFSLMNPIHPPIEKTSSSVTCNCCMSFRFNVDGLLTTTWINIYIFLTVLPGTP